MIFPNSFATFSFLSAFKSIIHCFPHERQPSSVSPPKKSVNLSVVESANCVVRQTFSRTLPRRKKVPPDIAVNAKTPSGYFALVLTTHFNATMTGGALYDGRHVTIVGLTPPLQQEKAPPDIYVNAGSFPKKFAMSSTAHFDVMMKGEDLPKGRSQPRALHAGIRTTGPDMIGAGTCFGRKSGVLRVCSHHSPQRLFWVEFRSEDFGEQLFIPDKDGKSPTTFCHSIAWIKRDDGTIQLKDRIKLTHLAAGGGNVNNKP